MGVLRQERGGPFNPDSCDESIQRLSNEGGEDPMEVVWREVGDLDQSLEGQVLSKVAFDVVDNGIDPFDISGTLLAELGPAERLPFSHIIACMNERLMAPFCQLDVGCGGDGSFASCGTLGSRLENAVSGWGAAGDVVL